MFIHALLLNYFFDLVNLNDLLMMQLEIMLLFIRYPVVLLAIHIRIQVYNTHAHKAVEEYIGILVNWILQVKQKDFFLFSTEKCFIF